MTKFKCNVLSLCDEEDAFPWMLHYLHKNFAEQHESMYDSVKDLIDKDLLEVKIDNKIEITLFDICTLEAYSDYNNSIQDIIVISITQKGRDIYSKCCIGFFN